MKEQKVYVLGDIHGWDTPVLELFNKVKFDYNIDKLIFIGDVCDRGPRTWEVIEILLKIKNLIWVNGNHDTFFKDYLKDNNDFYDWFQNGGKHTLKSYEEHGWANIESHKKLLHSTVLYHVENNICFVHGGMDRYRFIAVQHESILCWDRDMVNEVMLGDDTKLFNVNGFDKIFVGHTPTIYWKTYEDIIINNKSFMTVENPIYTPIIKAGVYLIDTGCGKSGPLTLYDVYVDKYYQSKKHYG